MRIWDFSGGILRRRWRLRFGFWGTRPSRVLSREGSGFVRVGCRNRLTERAGLVLFEIDLFLHLRREHCCYTSFDVSSLTIYTLYGYSQRGEPVMNSHFFIIYKWLRCVLGQESNRTMSVKAQIVTQESDSFFHIS